MRQKGVRLIIDFLIRAALGLALIFFVNEFLSANQIPLSVGINPVTFAASGTLGVPGVALLYGITIYQGL